MFDSDTSRHEMLISQTMARRYWPEGSAVGQRFRLGADAPWITVAGIVGDVRVPGGSDLYASHIYTAFSANVASSMLIVRTGGPSPHLAAAVARIAANIDPAIRIRDITTMDHELAARIAGPRFIMVLLGAFALFALVLAAVGLYGVIAYSVTQRMRELGVRIALGATPRGVLRLVMSEGARLAGFGLVIGLALGGVTAHALRGLLYDVAPLDPATFAAVAAVLALVALGASYVPAHRASRVDPVLVLHAE
jgi:putative ABC transport system permease protein